jgi:hypothetical protein
MYAWENSFEQHIMKIRDEELAVMKRTLRFNIFMQITWVIAPFLVLLFMFFSQGYG